MCIYIDWPKLKETYETLRQSSGLQENADIIFVIVSRRGGPKKLVVKFKEFLNVFWTLSNDKISVSALLVQDVSGRILYRHRLCNQKEEVLDGIIGGKSIISTWDTLNQETKDIYIKILLSQIQSYEL